MSTSTQSEGQASGKRFLISADTNYRLAPDRWNRRGGPCLQERLFHLGFNFRAIFVENRIFLPAAQKYPDAPYIKENFVAVLEDFHWRDLPSRADSYDLVGFKAIAKQGGSVGSYKGPVHFSRQGKVKMKPFSLPLIKEMREFLLEQARA